MFIDTDGNDTLKEIDELFRIQNPRFGFLCMPVSIKQIKHP